MKYRFSAFSFCVVVFVFCTPPHVFAATAQSVCVSLSVGSTTDAGDNCSPPVATSTPTTTPTTTLATPPSPSTVTSPSALAGPAIIPNVSDITVGYQGNSVVINWHNPTDAAHFSGVRIVRSSYTVPLDQFSGKVVYQGSGTYALDTGGIPGTVYYYTAFSYDAVGNYSSGAVFFAVWPSVALPVVPQSPNQTQNQFPVQSVFPPLFPQTTSSSSPLLPSTGGRQLIFSLTDISFIQDGRVLLLANSTITADGTMPLVVAVADSAVARKISGGLARAMIAINILGHESAYLLRESAADQASEARLDLTTVPAGGYPFVVEFWPNRGEPFAVSGTLVVTGSSTSTGILGTGISFAQLGKLLILLALFSIFILLIHRARRHQNQG